MPFQFNPITNQLDLIGLTSNSTIGPGQEGTGVANPTAHTLPVAEGSSPFNFLGPLTSGQLLIGSTGADPVAASLSAGSGISITPGAGSISIASTVSGGVTGPGSSTNTGIATWNGTGGTALNSPPSPLVTSGGVVTNSNQPSFLVYLSANQSNATGAGVNFHVPFDTKVFDQGTYFTTGASALFTAPIAGKYFLAAGINVFTNTNTGCNIVVQIVATSRTLQAQLYVGAIFSSVILSVPISGLIDMSANDTVYVNVNINATGSNSCQINGSASPYVTFFSGYLVG